MWHKTVSGVAATWLVSLRLLYQTSLVKQAAAGFFAGLFITLVLPLLAIEGLQANLNFPVEGLIAPNGKGHSAKLTKIQPPTGIAPDEPNEPEQERINMLYLNTDHLARCQQTLQSSLMLYQRAEAGSIDQEVFRNAIVKSYELAQETAFKLVKKALKAYGHSGKKLESTPVKEILRLAAVHDLMTLEAVERWFAYRDNRNNTAHDYGEAFAKQTLVLIPNFLVDVECLAETLEKKLGKLADA